MPLQKLLAKLKLNHSSNMVPSSHFANTSIFPTTLNVFISWIPPWVIDLGASTHMIGSTRLYKGSYIIFQSLTKIKSE